MSQTDDGILAGSALHTRQALTSTVATTRVGPWPAALTNREQWMGRGGASGKQPFAPWADADQPGAGADEDARWKWSLEANYAEKAVADEWVRKDPRLAGWAFILTETTPLVLVDADDVRDPATGTVHPGVAEWIDTLGRTYVCVSDSGSGLHAYYEGRLPDDDRQIVVALDDEPWRGNDAPPTLELYEGPHVCAITGHHLPGMPVSVASWDGAALETLLADATVTHRADRSDGPAESSDRTRPTAGVVWRATDTTDDVGVLRDVVDSLRARDFPLQTSQVDTDATGWEVWDPSTYRHSASGASLHHVPGKPVFYDFKHGESFNALSLFAAEQGIINRPWDSLTGVDWWTAVERAREEGAPIPRYESPGESSNCVEAGFRTDE